jgi:hypothetical protein
VRKFSEFCRQRGFGRTPAKWGRFFYLQGLADGAGLAGAVWRSVDTATHHYSLKPSKKWMQ